MKSKHYVTHTIKNLSSCRYRLLGIQDIFQERSPEYAAADGARNAYVSYDAVHR